MSADWHGPGAPRARRKFSWHGLLWSLVWPRGGQRIAPTVSGTVLIALSIGLGTAAYNSSSNILFITLALLLACLILSGVLSWMNVRDVAWRIDLAPPLRVGQETSAAVELRNGKKVLPTYGLWFELVARPLVRDANAKAESTWTGRGIDVRAVLKKAAEAEARGTVALRERLDPRGSARLEWRFRSQRRGALEVEIEGVGSLFPFGFLKKLVGTEARRELVVWPAPIEYRRFAVPTRKSAGGGERVARAGGGADLFALRKYAPGDSHRLIHWKASARSGQWLVRQFSAESAEGFSLWLRTDGEEWVSAEQFETLLSFAVTLAEDLFRSGQLDTLALNDTAPRPVRRVLDLEAWLDEVSGVRRREAATTRSEPTAPSTASGRNVIVFAPEGARGVAALLHGERIAAT